MPEPFHDVVPCGALGEGRRDRPTFCVRAACVFRSGGVLLQRPTSFGYACGCPDISAPSRPAVVLDPFGGTGTTAAVASALGRVGISVDLSHDYSRLAQWRTTDPATRAKIRGLPKPARQLDGQISLYDEDVAS